ncbi:MAG: DUF1330 domain-containing protein [Dehalococcoidia bacterium]
MGEFSSSKDLRAWYESDAYREILPLRLESTTSILFFVEGFSLPPIDKEPQG